MVGSLSRELCIEILRLDTQMYILRHPTRDTAPLWACRSIFVQKFKQRGWSSKCTVLEVEGTSHQGRPCRPEGQSSKGLDPETSHPAAFSTGTKLGGRLGTCCGKSCQQGPKWASGASPRPSGDCRDVQQRRGSLLS